MKAAIAVTLAAHGLEAAIHEPRASSPGARIGSAQFDFTRTRP